MWGILAIVIAFIVFWVYFQRLQGQKPDISQGPFSLSTKPEVGSADATKLLLNTNNTGTLLGFVYPLQAQKTGTMTLCNPTGSENPGEPECSTGQYNLCKCIGSDCSRCLHSGYVNVLNVSNVIRLELLAAPDAGRPNAAGTQLVVRTIGMGKALLPSGATDPSGALVQLTYMETIPLQDIPFQKWTYIAIAREGRRFDIYYNGKLVASKRTQYVPDIRAAFSPIVAGDPNLTGKIALVESLPEKLNQSDIQAKYQANADTTGEPKISAPLNIFDYMPNCEGGGCVTGPKMRPTSPLQDWDTQYA
jgi:hypothetical protein